MRPTLCAALLFAAAAAVAQTPAGPTIRLSSVFPPGARAGTSVDVTATGTDFDDAAHLLFSHPKITAVLVVPPEPPADPKKKDAPKKKDGPKPTAVFKVTVAADVPPGVYDVRAVGKYGVTNPRAFAVGTLPEVAEKEPNNDLPEAQSVELNTVVNGAIAANTDVDYCRFAGKAGQRVVLSVLAAGIDGRGRPLVELYAADGRRLAANRNYRDTDAVLDAVLPTDGDYFVRLCEFAYQTATADSFYRLTLSTGPWVDAVFPPNANPGDTVTVFGRNLPGGVASSIKSSDGVAYQQVAAIVPAIVLPPDRVPPPLALLNPFAFRLAGSNAVPLFPASAPVVLEKEAGNDDAKGAEVLPVPCELAGRVDKRFDRDWFAVALKKGDAVVFDLQSERLGAATDMALTIFNSAGAVVAGDGPLDDEPDTLHPQAFYTKTLDPAPFKFTAPADGTFNVLIASRTADVSFGPRSVYRLIVRKPKPDFAAVVMARSRDNPGTVCVRADGTAALDVFVHRIDGFNGVVTATASGLPAGVTAVPALIGPGQRWGTIVLSGQAGLKDGQTAAAVTVTADLDGKPAARAALPASLTWGSPAGNNNPFAAVARRDRALWVAARADAAGFAVKPDLAKATLKSNGKDSAAAGPEFVLKPGDKLSVPVVLVWPSGVPREQPVQLSTEATLPASNQGQPVAANNGQPLAVPKDKADAVMPIEVRNSAPPGLYSITLRAETPTKAGKDKKDGVAVAYAAPFRVFVVPTSLAKLTVQAAPVKAGAAGTLTVKVERQFEFAGEFAVAVAFPKDSGLSAPAATIPAGKDEVIVPVTAAKGAKPGPVASVAVTATASYAGKYNVTHDAKVSVNVGK